MYTDCKKRCFNVFMQSIIVLMTWVSICVLTSCSKDDDYQEAKCVDSVTTVELSEKTAMNFSGQEVVDLFSGDWQCDLTWNEIPETFAVIHPNPGITEAQISISYTGGEIKEITSKRVGGDKYTRLSCEASNRLEISANVNISSTDGALAENWDVVVSALNMRNVLFTYQPESFNGTYSYTPSDAAPQNYTAVTTSFWIGTDDNTDAAEGSIFEWSVNETATETDDGLIEAHGQEATTAEWECVKKVAQPMINGR